MRRRSIRFFYAPEPAKDELLGSWINRLALGQESCGSALVGTVDVDWAPSQDLLAWLAEGGEQSVAQLREMTLSARYPGQLRRDFARSLGSIFPVCHAYCPICAQADRERHGEVIQRATDAGLWRLMCREHRCFLQSAGEEGEITPHRLFDERTWAHGRHTPLNPVAAPPVSMAFERAMDRAKIGQDSGPLWLERDPKAFKDAATVLANVSMVIRRAAGDRPTPAWALLGARHPELYGRGVPKYEPSLLRRLDTSLRILAWTAAARLLLKPTASSRLGEEVWWVPPAAQRDFRGAPWIVATNVMSVHVWEGLWLTAADWGRELREEIRRALAAQYARIGASPPTHEST